MGFSSSFASILCMVNLAVFPTAHAFVAPSAQRLLVVSTLQQQHTQNHHHQNHDSKKTQRSALVLSAMDPMTLNWMGLAVGTVASVVVGQNPNLSDQIREAVSGSASPVLVTTVSPPVPQKKEPMPVVVTTKPAPPPPKEEEEEEEEEAPKITLATTELKQKQQDIRATLDQVGSKLESTTTEAPIDKIYTEPYSDTVKRSIQQKSRVLEKLSKKLFLPWKRWSDL